MTAMDERGLAAVLDGPSGWLRHGWKSPPATRRMLPSEPEFVDA
jgi:hypothetical protein